jgi:hypothetical protein
MPHLGLRDVPEEFESGGDFPEKIIAKCISCSRTQGRASCAALLRLPGHLQNLAVWSHVIDYYESSGHGLPHYVEWLEQHGYCGGVDWWPHDGRVQEFGSGRTRAEIMISLGRQSAYCRFAEFVTRAAFPQRTTAVAMISLPRPLSLFIAYD